MGETERKWIHFARSYVFVHCLSGIFVWISAIADTPHCWRLLSIIVSTVKVHTAPARDTKKTKKGKNRREKQPLKSKSWYWRIWVLVLDDISISCLCSKHKHTHPYTSTHIYTCNTFSRVHKDSMLNNSASAVSSSYDGFGLALVTTFKSRQWNRNQNTRPDAITICYVMLCILF